MIRGIISIIRSILVGPVLSRISHMRPGDVDNFLLSVSGAGSTQGLPATPSVSSQAVDELKAEVARLSERVDVLERLTVKAHHTVP